LKRTFLGAGEGAPAQDEKDKAAPDRGAEEERKELESTVQTLVEKNPKNTLTQTSVDCRKHGFDVSNPMYLSRLYRDLGLSIKRIHHKQVLLCVVTCSARVVEEKIYPG